MTASEAPKSAPVEGLILSTLSDYHEVLPVAAPQEVWLCQARGRLRLAGEEVLPGDRVLVEQVGPRRGRILGILPRATRLVRPQVANVDQALVVFTLVAPAVSTLLVDRLLVLVRAAGVTPVLVLNKADLAPPAAVAELLDAYRQVGYPIVATVAVRGTDDPGCRTLLADVLPGHITVCAGPSGVGKSSLIRGLCGVELEVGEVSPRFGRGRHTTRRTRLIPLPQGGFVADTPGFSALDLEGIDPEQVQAAFPEFARFAPDCRFADCLHLQEPGCRVAEASTRGELPAWRLEHYRALVAEVRARRETAAGPRRRARKE